MDTKIISADHKRRSFLWFLLGILFGAGLTYTFSVMMMKKELPPPPSYSSHLSKEQLFKMMPAVDTDSVRFYNAQITTDAATATVVAGAVDATGKHLPDASGTVRFSMFKALTARGVEVGDLSWDDATVHVLHVRDAGRKNFSVNLSKEALNRLLAVRDCMGIGFTERTTSAGDPTFELAPVKYAGGVAYPVGTAGDVVVCVAPCPRVCGPDASLYLHGPTLGP
ncbi:MAG: hypothetical protein JNM31_05790 [Flavobacteriales bacterium]|nr:hypothetical protein [Flavobacteriales bacterium]